MTATFNRFLVESGLSRIHQHISEHSAGAITAYRGDLTKSENRSRNKKLLAYIQRKGYSVTSVKGSYVEHYGKSNAKEVGEASFFVVNRVVDGDDGGKLESDLQKLGKLFDQDSILSVRNGKGTLIGTSKREDSFPGYGVHMSVGASNFGSAAGEFFSRVKGRPFAFESIDSIDELIEPRTINGIRARGILSDRVEEELKSI